MKRIFSLLLMASLSVAAYAQYNVVDNRVLKYDQKGKFKIVQFTDVHYQPENYESRRALDMMTEVLGVEMPDLVILTGDIVWAEPIKTAFDKVLGTIIDAGIPWAVVFGNHDDEYSLSRKEIMEYFSGKPYNMSSAGTDAIAGVGNYVLEVIDPKTEQIETLLYCMDSRSYASPETGLDGYGWFDRSQVNWYADTSKAYKEKNNGKPVSALSFFHIPLFEYAVMIEGGNAYVGSRTELECCGKLNTGMFSAMKEAGGMMGVFVGHDHNNDYIGDYQGVALAYGRFSGGNTVYNDLGENGCRVIELEQGKQGFKTHILLKGGERLYPVEYPADFVREKENK